MMKSVSYLQLDCIKTDIQLMKLLPQAIARRYHALPVATAGGKITIAMASPEDTNASAAIASVIDAPVCFVQANLKEIEQRLDEIWLQIPTHRPRLLLWSPISDPETMFLSYALSLANLLNTNLEQVDITLQDAQSFNKLILTVERSHPDLVIFQGHNLPLLDQVLYNFTLPKLAGQAPISLLIAQNPRWPLATILLVLLDKDCRNQPAVNWAIELASPCQAAVTVLPLLTSSADLNGMVEQDSVQALLKIKDLLGKNMRYIAQQFSEEGVKGTFKLREGELQDQFSCELLASDPDLVIIADVKHSSLWQWVSGDQFVPFLKSINCPVLISR